MAGKRLLYLDGIHLAAWFWQAGTLREEGRFALDEAGQAAFAEYLARHRTSNFSLLADLSDEGFQVEMLPFAQGADRAALLQRRLGQHFHGSPLATAISYGREKDGRKDEQFLLTAFTRPQTFEPWLAALRAAQTQLAGVWSLPLLGGPLMARLQPGSPRGLLVSITGAGVRQSYFENNQLKFSRLTTLSASNPTDLARVCAAEPAKIYQYLLGQRLIKRGSPLPVVMLVNRAHLDLFRNHCASSDELQFNLHSLHDAAQLLKLKTPPQDFHSETLFLHLLALDPPREQHAAPTERRLYRIWQARNWMLRIGAFALVAGLIYAGREWVNTWQVREQTALLQQQSEIDLGRYQAIQKTYPPMPTDADNLRAVINRYDALVERSPAMAPTWRAISEALESVPRIEIERIEWQVGEASGAGATGTGRVTPNTAGAAAPGTPGGLQVLARIHGQLPISLALDQRAQLDLVNAFADALRTEDTRQVVVEQMPFDIESGKSLKSSSESGPESQRLGFILQLSRKR